MVGRDARALLVVAGVLLPRAAHAELACDAGVVCPDRDGDGFAACGCPWSGTPCDCDDGDPAVHPNAPERCDADRDLNCSGVTPDACPRKKGCYESVCVPECVPLDDFGCATGSTFAKSADGKSCLCAPEDCSLFGCPAGLVCDEAKRCVPICHPGVRCPAGQICRGSGCVEPCAEVTCPEGAVCRNGLCLPSCACDPGKACPPGEVCELGGATPACVEPACVGVRCPAGEHCERGACVDDCEGVVCPPMRVCRRVSVNGAPSKARCVDLCNPSPCKPGFACAWRTGACTELPHADGGLLPDEPLIDPLTLGGGTWLCSGAPGPARAAGLIGGTISLAAALAWARRRRR